MKLRFKRENALLAAILFIYVLYFTAIIYFSLKVETVALFELITESKVLLSLLLALFLLMLFLVLYNLVQILIDRYRGKQGARFRLRVTLFVLLITSIPLIPLSVISNSLISTTIGYWFMSGVEDSLTDAMEVSRELYARLSRESLDEWRRKCGGCSLSDLEGAQFETIDGVISLKRGDRSIGGYAVRVLFARDSSLAEDMKSLNPGSDDLGDWKRVPVRDREYLLVPVSRDRGSPVVVRRVQDTVRNYTLSIVRGLQNYRVLKVVRRPIRVVISLVFVVAVMPFVLLAFYIGLLISKGVTSPIGELAVATQKVASGDLDYRIRYRAKDELRILIGSFNSMTEELRMNRELLKFSERSAAWRDIARKIAHEIKNPLTPIKLSAERMLKLYRGDDQFREILAKGIETIITEVNAITNMVNEFANFARFPESKLERADIIALLEEVVSSLRHTYKNIEFSFHHREQSVYLLIDREQMRRAVLNIVYNGINALPEDSRAGRIAVECFTPKGRENHYAVAVTDNGTGIDDEIKDMIFKPYYSKDGRGSGLGLTIAEKIIFENRGRIWFESEPGKTTFYMEFPKE